MQAWLEQCAQRLTEEMDRQWVNIAVYGTTHPGGTVPVPEEGLTLAKLQQARQALPDALRDAARGALLCETCFDAMTDQVLPAAQTATGLDEACCAACWPRAQGEGGSCLNRCGVSAR